MQRCCRDFGCGHGLIFIDDDDGCPGAGSFAESAFAACGPSGDVVAFCIEGVFGLGKLVIWGECGAGDELTFLLPVFKRDEARGLR